LQITKPFKFSYINAKCRALKSYSLKKEFFLPLLSASGIGDIYSSLKRTNYGEFILEPEELQILEGINKYFENLFLKITHTLDKKEKEIFYLFFFKRKQIIEKKLKYKNEKDIEEYFKKIDLEFLKEIQTVLKSLSLHERQVLKSIIGSYFDLLNLLTIIKFKFIYNLKTEEIFPFLINSYYKINLEILFKVGSASNFSELSNLLIPFLKKEFNDYTSFRKAVYNYHIIQLNKAWYGFPFKISVPFATLRLKEIEIKNIKAILEGKKFNISADEIERMLLGV